MGYEPRTSVRPGMILPRASPKVDGPAVLCPEGVGQGIHAKGYNKKPQKTCQVLNKGSWLTWATLQKQR